MMRRYQAGPGLAYWFATMFLSAMSINAFSFIACTPRRWSPTCQTVKKLPPDCSLVFSNKNHRYHHSLSGRSQHRLYSSDDSDSSVSATDDYPPSMSQTTVLVGTVTWYFVWLFLAFATSPPLPLDWKAFWLIAGVWNLFWAASLYAWPLWLRIPTKDRPSVSRNVGLAGVLYASMAVPEVEALFRPVLPWLVLVKFGILPWALSNGFLVTTTNATNNGEESATRRSKLQHIWCFVGLGDALFGLYFLERYLHFAV